MEPTGHRKEIHFYTGYVDNFVHRQKSFVDNLWIKGTSMWISFLLQKWTAMCSMIQRK